ncbi:FOG: CBS domain [Hahella chejuensis KCTC 2396]|uniref:FOG: CBS domain n=1 Tax=Hahella chejuensis (strain KCTC 2396) TaxID=349521 RepID=Q2SIH4_HAHCH|nr:CBS domain-containing protein [Hahella chejuensis]ABC29550.1 FOG: CBS domain [Hahella chejuensis KCTC 2396]
MQVREVMSAKPEFLSADATIRDAAVRMKEKGCGCVPVARNDRLIGMLTDRDITIRAVAEGKGMDEKVGDLVQEKVLYCYQEDDVKDVLKNMKEQKVQRLVVLKGKDDKDFVGMVTVGDIADKCADSDISQSIANCCKHYH